MEQVSAFIIISGIVQGVGFRYFTINQAKAYGLKGYVKNKTDGKVEIEVEGTKEIILEFIKQLHIGPSSADVKDIEIEWSEYKNKYDVFILKW